MADTVLDDAKAVEHAFRLGQGLYLLGSLERGLTVYNQQLRAHNLVWALWEKTKDHRWSGTTPQRIAVVGGGIAGLTAAAGFLLRFPEARVTVFERLWDLCPLQQGSDTRWIHPRIYRWPEPGSRAPGASVPLLNWSEGRASDIARGILREFGAVCDTPAPPVVQGAPSRVHGDQLEVVLGLKHFRITAATLTIEWAGNVATRTGDFFQLGTAKGTTECFDCIILAAGFGLERTVHEHPTPSYWRNEQLGQPILDGTRRNFVVSGYGDGALTELCRLTIERYRQDTILPELFGSKLRDIEAALWKSWHKDEDQNAYDFLAAEERWTLLEPVAEQLTNRIRKDTRVLLHIRGPQDSRINTIRDIFGRRSSFLNRLMTFLLYRCGAYSISFDELKHAAHTHGAPGKNVICRYGADTMNHILQMFTDAGEIKETLALVRDKQQQSPARHWVPGTFPPSLARGG